MDTVAAPVNKLEKKVVEEVSFQQQMDTCCAERALEVRLGQPDMFTCPSCGLEWMVTNNGVLIRDLKWERVP